MNYYQTLQVSRHASQEDITKAYVKLKNEIDDYVVIKQIDEAYDTLSIRMTRYDYDQLLDKVEDELKERLIQEELAKEQLKRETEYQKKREETEKTKQQSNNYYTTNNYNYQNYNENIRYRNSKIKPGKNRVLFIIIWYLFGLFGGHWFYNGNYGRGLVYLFTLGLFCCGWLYDIKYFRKKHWY